MEIRVTSVPLPDLPDQERPVRKRRCGREQPDEKPAVDPSPPLNLFLPPQEEFTARFHGSPNERLVYVR
ncbi:hypothetical protein GN956_G17845 [Arapaima gigas]